MSLLPEASVAYWLLCSKPVFLEWREEVESLSWEVVESREEIMEIVSWEVGSLYWEELETLPVVEILEVVEILQWRRCAGSFEKKNGFSRSLG